MYYIERNEKEVVKYKVSLYEERLYDVRDRLIKDYSSIITICDYFCLSDVNKIETDHIKDFNNIDLKINFGYYIYPKLVILIDMLLNNNVSVLPEIINYEQEQVKLDQFNNDNYIDMISKDISKGLSIEFNVNDLKSYLNNIHLNNDDHTFLKEEIISCISFERIDSIKINEFYKMIDFLNLDTKDVFNYEIESVKKRTRKK